MPFYVGASGEDAGAWPPLLLFKCMTLQKWFRIQFDPELENQINDRLSIKKFPSLPFSEPSPDHSTFSRFKKRLSKEAIDQINTETLRQFESRGLTINGGIAVDARLVKSASRPVSSKESDELRKKHETHEGKLDKKGQPKKVYPVKYVRRTSATQFNRVNADKGYSGMPNRSFLATNKIADGIMRKESTTSKLT